MFQRSRRLRVEPLEDRRLLSVASFGNAFAANTQTAGNQLTFGQVRAGGVAADSDGDFVVVWSSEETSGASFDVIGQRFDSTGAAIGSEFRVNETTLLEQKFAAVAMDDDGDFVVTWSSLWQDGGLYGVYARQYDAAGTPLGGEFRVNETIAENQSFSAVAMDGDGDFTIAWTSTDQDGDRTGVFARRYAANGAAVSGEIAVNTTTAGNQRYPVIASDSVGGTVVVWTSDGQDGSSGGIFAQRLASDGSLVGGEFQVNTTTDGNQQLPSVAMSPGGNFLVAWQGFDLTDGKWKAYAQVFDATGSAVGSETVFGTGRHVSAAIGELGDFVVAWEAASDADPSVKEIRIQHFDPVGNTNGAKMAYHTSLATLTAPSITMQGSGAAVLIWTATGLKGEGSDVDALRLQVSLNGDFNHPPVIAMPGDATIDEDEPFVATVSATDPDNPPQDLTYALAGNPPAGATLDPITGQFAWTPDDTAGGQTFEIAVRVTDSGTPPLSDQGSFQITVGEVNQAPVLTAIDDVSVTEGELVSLTFTATDADVPAQTLTYTLDPSAPAEASIDPVTGELSWTPGESYGGGQHTITVIVTDDGTPALSDSTSFTVTVGELNSPPTIVDPGVQVLEMGELLSLALEADDSDLPPNTLAWSLDAGAPDGVVIDPQTGQLTWTPTAINGLGSHTIPIRVTDNGSPSEFGTLALEVVVEAAMLEKPADRTIDEETELSVQAVLTPPYDQATGLTFSLDPGAPTGATIDGQSGLFTWTPSEQQGPGEYTITLRVTDDADADYTDAESFVVTVLEVNAPPQLEVIADITVKAGAPFYLPLKANDPDSETLVFSATTTDPQLAATVSDTNRSLRLNLNGFGLMEFELFESRVPNTTARIIELVESDFYDGLLIHRVAQMLDGSPFVIQGGDPNGDGTGGSGVKFDDEFHVDLQHTAAGVLSMANSGDDTNDSQFFVTGQATRFLDFDHAVFGYQTAGEDVRTAIEAVATDALDKPLSNVVIQSTEIFVDPQTGLLVLVAPEGFTGEVDVTVTVADSAGLNDQHTFHVTVVPDTDSAANSPPILGTISDIETVADQPVTVTIPATDPENDTIYFSAEVVGGGTDLSVTIHETTGEATITPTASAAGVYTVRFAVGATSGEQHDSQLVPVLVQPSAPMGIALAATSDTGWSSSDGLTNLNNDAGSPLAVRVSGVVTGAFVTLYADGEILGSATATGSGTVTITTNETYVLTDGPHSLTAIQEFVGAAVDVGNRHETVDLSSGVSAPVEIIVDTALPQITSTAVEDAMAYVAYSYDVESVEEATGGVRYELGSGPTGMSIDPATGIVSWPSPTADGSPHSVTVRAVDEAGNATEQAYELTVVINGDNLPPSLDPIADTTVSEGDTVQFTATASDDDVPAQSLTFSLDAGAPAGATIDPATGAFLWTTGELDGSNSFAITVRVTDSGTPAMSDAQSFTITVDEGNTAPVLSGISDQTVAKGTTVQFTATAADTDIPVQTLTYSLDAGAPVGARIDPNTGAFFWTTTEAGLYSLTVRVTDDGPGTLSDTEAFTITVDEDNTEPVLAAISDQTVTEGASVQFTASATDTDLPAQTLSYSLDAGAPAGASIDPATGVFSWTTTEADGPGVYTITVRVTDDGPGALSDTESLTITVEEGNTAPNLAAIPDRTVAEGTTVQLTASATDSDLPVQTLTYSLDAGAPTGASIDPISGHFSWTTTEADGPGVYSITVRVADDGPGMLDDTQTFSITVDEANAAPVLATISNVSVIEGGTAEFVASATDSDLPVQGLAYSLDAGAPEGAGIDPVTGQFTWTTGEADGPGVYAITVRVTDDGPGALWDSQSFTVTVDEANTAPVLAAISNQAVTEGDTVQLMVSATDDDLPAQTLTYSLDGGAPAGASVNPVTGQFTWTTTEATGPGEYAITVRVTDDGPGALDDTESFSVTVDEENTAPVLVAISNQTVTEGATVQFTATASDVDLPIQTLTYTLDAGAPTGATINPVTGQFTWTTSEAIGPGVYAITVRVTDDGPGALDDAQSFTITVDEDNTAPLLTAISNQTVTEGATVQLIALAADADLPVQTLAYSLDAGAPSGATLDPVTGQFTWTTTEADGPGVYSITVRVTDDGPGTLHDTESFTVTVEEDNTAPVLAAIPNQTVTEGVTVQLTATGSDADLPLQTLTYTLDAGAPTGASINPVTGEFTWTTTEADGPGVYSITVRVADNGAGTLDDTESFTITVNETNTAPVLTALSDQTVTEGATIQFIALATDADVPVQTLTYSLDAGAPSGVTIHPDTGQFTWSTTEADGPGVHSITVRVTDDGPGALSDTQSFSITVNENNTAPVLAAIADQTVAEGDTVQFTASATDTDMPVQTLTYTLDAGAPAGASIDAVSGQFTWTTTASDGPGVVSITVRVADNGPGSLSDTESFTITVEDGATTGGEIVFSGSTAIVTGTDGNDDIRVALGADHVVTINGISHTLDGELYKTIEIDGKAGDDTLSLVGNASDESIILRPEIAQFTGKDYQVNAVGFTAVTADGGGGQDAGRFYGAAGNDHLVLGPHWGQLTGEGFSLEITGCSEIHGIGGSADHDTAEMYDSPGDDTFIGKPEFSKLTGEGYFLRAKAFYEVVAKATAGGTDVASMVDSDHDDLFVANPTDATLTGPGYRLRGEGFESVHGYARNGGDDVARLYDSAGDDSFKATPEYAKMIGNGYYNRAKFFEQMLGYSDSGGHDLARFYDSDGNDTFKATPTYAWLSGEGYFLRAKAFDQYRAQASKGHDVAELQDTALNDLLEAEGNEARLSTPDQVDFQTLIAFDQVTARSKYDNDGDETDVAAILDFLLTLEGSW